MNKKNAPGDTGAAHQKHHNTEGSTEEGRGVDEMHKLVLDKFEELNSRAVEGYDSARNSRQMAWGLLPEAS